MQHHATLIVGKRDEALLALDSALREPGLDVVHLSGERMGIDDVRTLVHEANLMPFDASYRSFVLMYEHITHEAQNALLKILEEPPHTARFYLITDHDELLLPTLRSRLLSADNRKTRDDGESAYPDFTRASFAERLSVIAALVKKGDDVGMQALMDTIEVSAHHQGDVDTEREIVELRRAFNAPGASKKMILEHLALSLSRGA